jgi:hypothetical protein
VEKAQNKYKKAEVGVQAAMERSPHYRHGKYGEPIPKGMENSITKVRPVPDAAMSSDRTVHLKDAELKAGQKMRFSGRAVNGVIEGDMPVSVVNPHSNAAKVTHVKGGREYEGAFTHIRTATVERPAYKERPAKQFEAHHHTLKAEDRAVHLPRTAKKTWRKQVWS